MKKLFLILVLIGISHTASAQNWQQTWRGEIHQAGVWQTHIWANSYEQLVAIPGVNAERADIWVSLTPFANAATVHHYWWQSNNGAWVNLYTCNTAEEQQIPNPDYSHNILGYIYPRWGYPGQMEAGAEVCRRLHHFGTGDYVYTPDPDEVALHIALGYVQETDLGWLMPRTWPGPDQLDLPVAFIDNLSPTQLVQGQSIVGSGHVEGEQIDAYQWRCQSHGDVLASNQNINYNALTIGGHSIVFQAHNPAGWGTSAAVNVIVETPVSVNTIADQQGQQGASFSLQVVAGGGNNLQYSLLINQGQMLQINNQGLITGTLTTSGTWQIRVRAQSQGLPSNWDEEDFQLTVSAQAQPSIEWSPQSFAVSLIEGEESLQTLLISNAGNAQLTVGVQGFSEDNPNFISQIQPATLFLASGESQAVSFLISTLSLNAGQYQGHLLLTNSDPEQPYVEVPIELEVIDYFPDLKFPWPAGEEWVLTCSYGCGFHTNNNNGYYSLDFDKPGIPEGARAPILSASSGEVSFAGWNSSGYGNIVEVDAGHGYLIRYAHLEEMLVSAGQQIQQGQLIGRMGSTGGNWNDHLHFMMFYNGDCRSTVLQSRPEPMSGFGDFADGTGLFYLSDNNHVGGQGQPAIFAEFSEWTADLIIGQNEQFSLELGNSGFADLTIFSLLLEEDSGQLQLQNIFSNVTLEYEEELELSFEIVAEEVGDFEGSLLVFSDDLANNPLEITFAFSVEPITGIAEGGLPTEFALFGNFPNPFNPQTRIIFDLPQASPVQLQVYDLQGRVIAQLLSEYLPAGRHQVVWQAEAFSAGVYFVHLRASDFSQVGKMLLVK